MFADLNRRDFVKAGALAALGDIGFLHNLTPVSADEAKLTPDKVRFSPEIEPLVRLIEDTPQQKLMEAAADQVRRGASYQQMLAAVFLAGVRSIQARPVGFEFHCVLVINSAHLAAIASEDRDRWLPVFWAIDNFKRSQAIKQKKGSWAMPALDEAKLPPASQARQRFIAAMDDWDPEGADRAITALVRTAGAAEVSELFWRYGARDFRDIGHKAIYAANGWRTLQTIGWRHAEPVMRSLAFACLDHEGDNPARRDDEKDRPWRENLRRVGQIRPAWQRGKITSEATTDLLETLRQATPSEACERVVKHLNNEIDPASLWDGIFLAAGELLMRQPGPNMIVGLHCVTSVNALHYSYQASGNDETRRLMLLQAPAFLALFRKRMEGTLRNDLYADKLEKADVKATGPEAIEEVFAAVDRDKPLAARKVLALLESGTVTPEALMTAARRLIFVKGSDSHDYKFCSAALEDFYHATPRWQNRLLATSMFNLKGSGASDNNLIRRAREALNGV